MQNFVQCIARRVASHAQRTVHGNYATTMIPHREYRRRMETHVIAGKVLERYLSSEAQSLDSTITSPHVAHPCEYAMTEQTVEGWAGP